MNTSSYSAESILRFCLQTAEKQDGLPCKNIVFSNNSCIRRKRKFYYIIFFGVCVGGFKNFFGFLEIWCEMLGLEGEVGRIWRNLSLRIMWNLRTRHIPLETFHRNVSKISAQISAAEIGGHGTAFSYRTTKHLTNQHTTILKSSCFSVCSCNFTENGVY